MATLAIIEGPAKGVSFALESHRLVLIGRDEQCTFQVLDEQVSRRHMQIKQHGDGHVVLDYESRNGVFVNDRRITGDTPLHDGDEIRLGATVIAYFEADATDARHLDTLLRKHGEHRRQTMGG